MLLTTHVFLPPISRKSIKIQTVYSLMSVSNFRSGIVPKDVAKKPTTSPNNFHLPSTSILSSLAPHVRTIPGDLRRSSAKERHPKQSRLSTSDESVRVDNEKHPKPQRNRNRAKRRWSEIERSHEEETGRAA